MKNKLPPCFAFKNSGKHPRKDEIRKRFNELAQFSDIDIRWNSYYGRNSDGRLTFCKIISNFGSTVVEITEDDFLAMTEPELTKLPDNFYFQYVDEKDREVLKERFNKITRGSWVFCRIDCYYGLCYKEDYCYTDKKYFHDSTEITQADFIRLTEPEKKVEPEQSALPYKGDIKDFPKEVGIWMMDCQEAQGNKRDISVFEKCRHDGNENGGFDWGIVDSHFCYNVIYKKNFATFFEKYPNYTSPKKTITGQIIEISERGILIELTQEQIKEFKIFETVTIKR
jgi:hypothetical protein